MATTSPDNIYYPTSATQIAPLETQFATLATSVQTALTGRIGTKVSVVADFDELAALGGSTGDVAIVTEGVGVVFTRVSPTWRQRSKASYSSVSNRDIAYAKASGVYRTQQAEAEVLGITYEWLSSEVSGSGGWFPVSGPTPAFSATGASGAPQTIPNGAWTQITTAFGTPSINSGFTSWSGGALTIAQQGLYMINTQISFNTIPGPARIGTQVTLNSGTADTGVSVKKFEYGTNSASTSRPVYYASGDVLRMFVFQDSGAGRVTDATGPALTFSAIYMGPR